MRGARLGLPLALAALAACGVDPSARADLAAHAEAARQPAELQVGDTRIHASLAPTAALSPAISERYGVDRARDAQLLLVGVRQGPTGNEVSVPAQVSARARDLRGAWQDIAMREVRSDGFVDYVGTVRVTPPDTLAFEITVRREGIDAPAMLRFSREVLAPSGG
ncbi:DUF4426 domain-containing protein [Luteimonas saliphila]|uniref:DUF4426 domain-containing protein n=1 Tax=Luteimonas saliphila TaxID=2804919 RepID=UPI00192D8024|nr:DUF4426 domain-containing protein [Luteimonas saliphila]